MFPSFFFSYSYTVLIVNIKVKEERAIPTGIPTTAAYGAILNAPNDADKVINIL